MHVDRERTRAMNIPLLTTLATREVYDLIPAAATKNAEAIRRYTKHDALEGSYHSSAKAIAKGARLIAQALTTQLPWDFCLAAEQAGHATAHALANHHNNPWYTEPSYWRRGADAIERSQQGTNDISTQLDIANLCHAIEHLHELRNTDTTFL